MTQYIRFLGSIVLLFLLPGVSFALDNEDKRVRIVKSRLDAKTVYIHLVDTMNSKPDCGRYSQIIACSLETTGCEESMSLSLAAKLSDRKIDFELTGRCIGNIPQFDRLTID